MASRDAYHITRMSDARARRRLLDGLDVAFWQHALANITSSTSTIMTEDISLSLSLLLTEFFVRLAAQ
jgi:hypothetical protein